MLLHTVLDQEVDNPPAADQALLPSVIAFLSSFPDYLDIVVQCTRKTEVRSWRTLFAHLPPSQVLFDESLEKGLLKTAGGYLLVLNEFEGLDTSLKQCTRLLREAKEIGDWDLCRELARFLMALDDSGGRLREAMVEVGIDVGDSMAPMAGELPMGGKALPVVNGNVGGEEGREKDYFAAGPPE
jgi:hypothetical protein